MRRFFNKVLDSRLFRVAVFCTSICLATDAFWGVPWYQVIGMAMCVGYLYGLMEACLEIPRAIENLGEGLRLRRDIIERHKELCEKLRKWDTKDG